MTQWILLSFDGVKVIFSPIGQYALRIMVVVSQRDDGSPIRGRDLATLTGVPPAYLSKVCRRLTEAGLLLSQRGHYGGFRLARPAEGITFAEVLDAVDSLPTAGECAFGWGPCASDDGPREEPCPLHERWSELSGHIQRWADSSVLTDADPVSEPPV